MVFSSSHFCDKWSYLPGLAGLGAEADRAGCSHQLSILIWANLISSSVQPSFLWKHLKGENDTKKHRNLFSSQQAFVIVPVPKCTNVWLTKSLWYTFLRVQEEKINKELVTSGVAKVARSLQGCPSSLHFWQRGRECQCREITLLVAGRFGTWGSFWVGSGVCCHFLQVNQSSFCQPQLCWVGSPTFCFHYLIFTGYSCFTMLCSFLLYSSVNQLYVYIHFLPFGSPFRLGHRASRRVPCAMQQVLISIYFIPSVNSVYTSVPIYQFLSPSFPTPSLKVKVLVSKLSATVCDPMDCSPPGSSVHEILQARVLGWIAILFSRGFSRGQTQVSCISGRFFTIWATRDALVPIHLFSTSVFLFLLCK